MNLYLCHGTTFVGTQADARKLDKDFIPTDVPTDKPGLIAYLNEYGRFNRASGRNDPIRQAPDAEIVQRNDGEARREATRRMTPLDMDAGAVLARMDQPGIDAMIETIATSTGYPLRRFAAAVALAFNNLAKGS